jgi:hypothetical protein
VLGLLSAHPGALHSSATMISEVAAWWRGHGCLEGACLCDMVSRRGCSAGISGGTSVVRLVILSFTESVSGGS